MTLDGLELKGIESKLWINLDVVCSTMFHIYVGIAFMQKTWIAKILTLDHKLVLAEGFQHHVSFHFWEMVENANVMFPHNNTSLQG